MINHECRCSELIVLVQVAGAARKLLVGRAIELVADVADIGKAALARQPGAADALVLKGMVERDRGDAAKGKADIDAALAEAPQAAQGRGAFGVS